MFNTLIVHTNELILKGGNRAFFERRLAHNLSASLAGVPILKLSGGQGGMILFRADRTLTAREEESVRLSVSKVFGVAAFMFARECASELVEIQKTAVELAQGLEGTFKVKTRRRDKKFSLGSMEISAEVGRSILDYNTKLKVDVHEPQHVIEVSVDIRRSFVAAGRELGAGGLPTGTSGRVACLLSGGIDSPAAAWKLMRRGCEATMIHFHSYPYVSVESLDKAERLARVLAGWQGKTRLFLVSIADAQRDIATQCDESMRVVLYRRLMLRIAEAIAEREQAKALVTGDAVGQVASQTLDNLLTVSEAVQMPIFRPLIGDDKEDITRLAKHVGSYEISILPHGDCCSLFMPKKPATHSNINRAKTEEQKYDMTVRIAEAIAAAELKEITA